jgi:hypothetical protein
LHRSPSATAAAPPLCHPRAPYSCRRTAPPLVSGGGGALAAAQGKKRTD